LAQRLGECFGGKVFFGNSGAEANEAAIKLARRWGHEHAGGRFEVISTLGSFHGRTLATLTATGQEKYHNGFFPLMPGFKLVPFNDLAAAERAIGGDSVAVMVEPIQGEGGVVVPATDYLRRLRDVCDRHNLLLIVDEIQVGIGRTGKFFAYQHAGIRPDIVTLAKALGGGIPIGAMLAKPEVAASFTPGSHGTTFGGNPVACAAALAVLDALEKENVIANAASMGQYLIDQLSAIAKSSEKISDVRGVGMIIGIVVKGEAKPIVDACLAEKLIVNGTAGNIVRLLPPLNLSRADADAALAILRRVLTS
jgi:acetylornithine/succinyldiaminopimelate/putrescine aminotransferase